MSISSIGSGVSSGGGTGSVTGGTGSGAIGGTQYTDDVDDNTNVTTQVNVADTDVQAAQGSATGVPATQVADDDGDGDIGGPSLHARRRNLKDISARI